MKRKEVLSFNINHFSILKGLFISESNTMKFVTKLSTHEIHNVEVKSDTSCEELYGKLSCACFDMSRFQRPTEILNGIERSFVVT